MDYTDRDLEDFCTNIWDTGFSANNGGMGAPDLFSLYYVLNKIRPKIVIESGVWNGVSTKLIRKVLPDSTILCLDPRKIPETGYIDTNKNTVYYTGDQFKDFKELDLSSYDPNEILVFFDCHQNACLRLQQCLEKHITHVFLNDNYPAECGSHFTIEHLMKGDTRLHSITDVNKQRLLDSIQVYKIFPNIYPGPIRTGEGLFGCESYFDEDNDKFPIFKIERMRYRWNTYVQLVQKPGTGGQ